MKTRVHWRALAAAAGLCSCTALAVDYRVIAEQNLFDPQRKPWPEPAAAAPAATASPLGPEDIEVQGVVVVGGVKRAIVKLGGRLRPPAPGGAAGRSNVILSEGQALGGYTLESVQAQQLVFASGGNRFTVPFARSARRDIASAPSPAPMLPVIQSASLPVSEPVPAAQPAAATPPQFSPPPPSALTTPQPQPAPPAATTSAPAQATGMFPGGQSAPQQAGAAAAAPPVSAPSPIGMSLLEAIQAADAARRAGQLPAAPVNPFQPKSP